MKFNSLILIAIFSFFLFSCDSGVKFNNPNDINSDAYNPESSENETNDEDIDQTDTDPTDNELIDTEPDNPDSIPEQPDNGNSEPDDADIDDSDSAPDNGDSTLDDDADTADSTDDSGDSQPDESDTTDDGDTSTPDEDDTEPDEEPTTRTATCQPKPENTVWNTVDTITQTYTSSGWEPSTTPVYNPEPSETECRYKCASGYYWNGTSCTIPDCISNSDCYGTDHYCSISTSECIANAVFITEYVEGSGHNRAIEIYNGSKSPIDLSNFTIQQANNGKSFGSDANYIYNFPASSQLAPGATYVVCRTFSDDTLLAKCNSTDSGSTLAFNGDDGIALFEGSSIVDQIGNPTDYQNWSVAGVASATVDHTLRRKTTVIQGTTDWDASAGTTTENSQWNVLLQDTFDGLGIR